LHKKTIRATEGGIRLMQVIKNPVEAHFPPNCVKIAFSRTGEKIVLSDLSKRLTTDAENKGRSFVFVLGAMAKGKCEADFAEHWFAISQYPLSGAAVASRICAAFEDTWNIH
ncbi:ribosomal biogenesis, methyltransferase, EMG1/NEP1, partial [Kipferlia bialata]